MDLRGEIDSFIIVMGGQIWHIRQNIWNYQYSRTLLIVSQLRVQIVIVRDTRANIGLDQRWILEYIQSRQYCIKVWSSNSRTWMVDNNIGSNMYIRVWFSRSTKNMFLLLATTYVVLCVKREPPHFFSVMIHWHCKKSLLKKESNNVWWSICVASHLPNPFSYIASNWNTNFLLCVFRVSRRETFLSLGHVLINSFHGHDHIANWSPLKK